MSTSRNTGVTRRNDNSYIPGGLASYCFRSTLFNGGGVMFRKHGLSLFMVFFIGAASAAMAAESASELLEKGIYTEETVGDLPKAIEIYQKVVGEAKVTEGYAAEAQYRLGQCLLKQKNNEEAVAAFKKLIESYPNQKEWIAKAKKLIPGEAGLKLGEVPWKDGEFMQLNVKLGGGMNIGTFVWSVDAAKLDGKDIWRMKTYRYILAGGDNRGVSQVDADKNTFQPIRSMFRHTLMGDTEAEYSAGEVTVTSIKDGKKTSSRKETLDKVYYDNEQGVELFRRLPLSVGKQVIAPIYVPFGGGRVELPVTVTGLERIEVPAGQFECNKIEIGLVNQTFWVSTDANHYLVKLEAGGVIGELDQIGVNKPGELKPGGDPRLGIFFRIPAGWYSYEYDMPDNKKTIKTFFLIDPDETASNHITVSKIEEDEAKDVKTDVKKALRAWADKQIAEKTKELKDLTVRPDSWQDRNVAGMPAVSFIADYSIDQHKKAAYGIFVMGQTTKAQCLIILCDPDKLDGIRTEFDKIVDTLKIK
jgi:hypothetical protein